MKELLSDGRSERPRAPRLRDAKRWPFVLSLAFSLVLGQPFAAVAAESLDATSEAEPPVLSADAQATSVTAEDVARLREQAAEIQEKAERIRGLQAAGPVPLVVRNEGELRQYLIERFNDVGIEVIEASERAMQLLGVLEPTQSYYDLVLELLTSQVAGYYEPTDATFYLLDTDLNNFHPSVIAHELQHALQDAHWDLNAMLRPSWRMDDALVSRSALAEGDAMVLSMDFELNGKLGQLPPTVFAAMSREILDSALQMRGEYPRYLIENLMAPYVYGMAFVHALYTEGGWAQVDKAFERLPVSSEQVLIPERYLEEDAPTFLAFDVSELGVLREANILGMLGMRTLFHQLLEGVLSTPAVEMSTRDWDGDRMELWSSPTADTLVWLSVFDEIAGAQSFFEMVEFTLPQWVPDTIPVCAGGMHGQRCGATTAGRGVLIERWGDLSLVIIQEASDASVTPASLLSIAEEVWHSHRRSAYPEMFRR